MEKLNLKLGKVGTIISAQWKENEVAFSYRHMGVKKYTLDAADRGKKCRQFIDRVSSKSTALLSTDRGLRHRSLVSSLLALFHGDGLAY